MPPHAASQPETAVPARPSVDRRDAWIATALGVAFVLVYRALRQRWLWTDGLLLGQRREWNDTGLWPHPAYLPVARALDRVGADPAPYGGLLAASWLPGGIAVAFAFLVARALGTSRISAVSAASILALAPVTMFFATTVEVHALHAAAVGIGAFVTLVAPWRRSGVAIAWTAIAFLPVALTHLFAVFLGLGWLALAAHAARVQGAPLAPRRIAFLLAPALVACGLVTFALNAAGYWEASAAGAVDGTLAQIARDRQSPRLAWWWEEVAAPLHVGGIAVLAGAASLALRARRDAAARSLLTTIAILAAPLFAFTGWFAIPNEGGYLLGLLPFLAGLAAFGFDALAARAPRALPLAAAVLFAGTALGGHRAATDWRRDWREQRRDERTEAVRAVLPGAGVFVSFDPAGQPIGLVLPGVRELHPARRMLGALVAGAPPEPAAAALVDDIERLHREHGGEVALDLSWRRMGASDPLFAPYALALHRELTRRFGLEERDDPLWPVARLHAH